MKLSNPPKLVISEGRIPGASNSDPRRAVYFEVKYEYESSVSEADFLEQNDLVILEKVIIMGFDPSNPGNDIDLRFSIRPEFVPLPLDQVNADYLRNNAFKVSRVRKPYAEKNEILDSLNVNGLMLDSVKATVQLLYTHIGSSDPVKV
jgi:hypothetical protein